MINWNKVIRTLKTTAEKAIAVKDGEVHVIMSAINGVNAVMEAVHEHEKAVKAVTRHCDKIGLNTCLVIDSCPDDFDVDECVKAFMLNNAIITVIIDYCSADESAESSDSADVVEG